MTAPPPVPALPDAARATTYAASNAAGPFAVGFDIYGDSSDYTAWVVVTLDGVEQVGNWTLDSPSGSLITLARPITDARITFTAPVTGNLVITGAQRPRRLAQNSENRGVTARDWNQAYTALIAMLRENWDARGRQLLAPPGESIGILPPAAQRVGQMLGFDIPNGNPIAAQPSSALVSSAMQDVVAAASHAAALALLGGAPLSAIIPVGMPAMWPGLSAPSLWLPRDGTTRLRAGFPELWAVLGPSMAGVVASGNTDVTGIGSTAGWAAGWPVEGTGIAPGTTINSILGANSIRMSAPATGNGTAIKIYPWGNGDGVNSFTLPNATGYAEAGLDIAQARLTGGHKLAAVVGNEAVTLNTTQIPAHAHGLTDPTHPHGGGKAVTENFAPAAGVANIWGGGAVNTDPAATGITVQNAGGGLSHPNVQPTQIYFPIIYAGR